MRHSLNFLGIILSSGANTKQFRPVQDNKIREFL